MNNITFSRSLLLLMLMMVVTSVFGQAYLAVSTNAMTFSSAANSQKFTISSNAAWTADKGGADWLTVEPASGTDDGTINVTATRTRPTRIALQRSPSQAAA